MRYIFVLILLLTSSHGFAQSYRLDQKEQSSFEAGFGVAGASIPLYPGSSQTRSIVLPFPSFIYRGDMLRADEDGGLRGRFFANETIEINTSLGFFLPAKSEDVDARQGMKDLDALGEVGPGVIFHIIPKRKNRKFSLSLNLGARIALSSDFKYTKYRGILLNPLLYSWYRYSKNLTFFNSISTTFSTKGHHAYFYDVSIEDSIPQRSQYQSKSGLFSTNLASFFIYNPGKKWSVFGGCVYSNYGLAANRDSPLHKRDNNLSGIFGITYWFYKSK